MSSNSYMGNVMSKSRMGKITEIQSVLIYKQIFAEEIKRHEVVLSYENKYHPFWRPISFLSFLQNAFFLSPRAEHRER